MTENPLTYIFSLQDKVSDKMLPITVASEKMLSIFADLQTKTAAVNSLFEQSGGSLGALQEKVALLKEEKQWIPEENKEAIIAYNEEIEALNRQINKLNNINGKGFEEAGVSIGSLKERIKQLKSEREWIPADNKEAISTCNKEIEGLTRQLNKLSSYNGEGIDRATNSIGGLQEKVKKLKEEREWIPAENTKKISECNKEIDKLTKQITKLSSVKGNAFKDFIGHVAGAIPTLKMFTSPASLVSGAIGKLNETIQKGEAAWSNYKKIVGSFQADIQKNVGATNEEVKSILALVDAQQQLGVVGKQVQMSGVQELSTHVTRHQSIQELLPVLNDTIAHQHGVNATQEQAAEIAKAFGATLNGQTDALAQYGYQFTEAQQKILSYGDEIDRVNVLTEIMVGAINGVNETLGETPEGQWQQHAEKMEGVLTTIGRMKEEFTQALFPVFQTAGDFLGNIVDIIHDKMDSIQKVLDAMATGISIVFETLGPVITNVVEALAYLFEELVNGNLIVVGMTGAIVAYTVASNAKAIATGLEAVATKILTGVQAAFNLVLNMSPLGWICLAIGGVIAIVTSCWQKFEDFRKVIMGVWEVIKGFGKALIDAIVDPIKQIIKGLGSVFSAISSAMKGNFREAGAQAKEGFKDIGVGLVKASPLGSTALLAANLANTDFAGAYQKGSDSVSSPQEATEVEEIIPEPIVPEPTTIVTTPISNKIGTPATTVTTPAESIVADKPILPDINPTAEYKAIVAGLTPQKVDLAPAKTATEAVKITGNSQEKTNNTVTSTSESASIDSNESTSIVNDKEQLYQPEQKEDILQIISENVQKIVDIFKNIGSIKNIFNTSVKTEGINIDVNRTEQTSVSGNQLVAYSLPAFRIEKEESTKDTPTIIGLLQEISLISGGIFSGVHFLIALKGEKIAGDKNTTTNGEKGNETSEVAQTDSISSINTTIEVLKNEALQQINAAKSTLAEIQNAFNSLTEVNLTVTINSGIEAITENLIGNIRETLQIDNITIAIKEAIQKATNLIDIDFNEVGEEIAVSIAKKLNGAVNSVMESDLVTNINTGIDSIKETIVSIPDKLKLDTLSRSVEEIFEKIDTILDIDLSEVGTKIVTSFVNELEKVFNSMMESDLVSNLNTGIDSIRETISSIPEKLQLEKLSEGAKEAISKVDTLMDIDLSEIGTEIVNSLAKQIERGFNGLMESDLVTNINTGIESITETITGIPEKLKLESWAQGVKDMTDKLNSSMDIDLSEIGTDLVNSFVNEIGKVFDSILESDLAKDIGAGMETIKDTIVSIPEKLKLDEIGKGVTEAISKVKTLTDIDLSQVGTEIATSFVNSLEKALNSVTNNIASKVSEGVNSIRDSFTKNVLDKIPLETIAEGVKETGEKINTTLDKIKEADPVEFIREVTTTAATTFTNTVGEQVFGIPPSANAPELPEEISDTENASPEEEKRRKKTSKGRSLVKSLFAQTGLKAVSSLSGGLLQAGMVIDNIPESVKNNEEIMEATSVDNELIDLPTPGATENEVIKPALPISTETNIVTDTDNSAIPEAAGAELINIPTLSIPLEPVTFMPETQTAMEALNAENPLQETQHEIAEKSTGTFDHFVDNIRHIAAVTAIPLAMATVSESSNLQSVSMMDENINTTSSMFDQTEEEDRTNGRSISIDQVCEQIVIHVENTDREGTEHIKDEIYKVLREIVEA